MNQHLRHAAVVAAAASLASTFAVAHDGHGTSDHHRHATDVGFLLVLAVVIAALVMGRRT
jgi:hypothetical protein